ncbi:MAG: hypothetical protein LIO74_11840 [Ruminococcus sp.]|nr:hypothetical protein [Ruminococcus sp.]
MIGFFTDFIGRILLYVISYIIMLGLILALAGISQVCAVIYLIAGVLFGWRFINFITPNMFIWMPLKGWLIYYIVKLFVAAFIGMLIVPYHLAKYVVALFDGVAEITMDENG